MSDDAYPISLEQVLFTRASVIAIPGHEQPEQGGLVSPLNKIELKPIPEHPHQFVVVMSCVINPEMDVSQPYSIDMECVASFKTDGTLEVEAEKRGVLINGHSVCYGAIREAVAWMTSRQPYGPVSLGMSVLKAKKEPDTEGRND